MVESWSNQPTAQTFRLQLTANVRRLLIAIQIAENAPENDETECAVAIRRVRIDENDCVSVDRCDRHGETERSLVDLRDPNDDVERALVACRWQID